MIIIDFLFVCFLLLGRFHHVFAFLFYLLIAIFIVTLSLQQV